MKITFCYTAIDAGSDWLEKEYDISYDNYKTIINHYKNFHQYQADKLNIKWNGNDSLYLNYRTPKDFPLDLIDMIELYLDNL